MGGRLVGHTVSVARRSDGAEAPYELHWWEHLYELPRTAQDAWHTE